MQDIFLAQLAATTRNMSLGSPFVLDLHHSPHRSGDSEAFDRVLRKALSDYKEKRPHLFPLSLQLCVTILMVPPEKGGKDLDNLARLILPALHEIWAPPSHGGTVLIGVANDGTLPGLADDYKATNPQRPGRDSYELWMRQTLGDRLGKEFDAFVKITFDEVHGKDVCIIRVAAGSRPACNVDKLPIRRGNRTVDLSLKEAIDYSRTRWSL